VADYALDTSALSRLVANHCRARALERDLRGTDHRLLVSQSVLEEILAVPTDQILLDVAESLERLLRLFGGRLLVSWGAVDIWRVEASRALARTPTFEPEQQQSFVNDLAYAISNRDPTHGGLNTSRTWVSKWKAAAEEAVKEPRRETRDAFRNRVDPGALGDELARYGPANVPDWLVERLLRIAAIPELEAFRVIQDTQRYHALRVAAALMNLTMFGDAIPPDLRTRHPYLQVLRTHRNNYFDCSVASSAAYADVFVVQDDDLRDKCVHLAQTGITPYRSMTLKEFERSLSPQSRWHRLCRRLASCWCHLFRRG